MAGYVKLERSIWQDRDFLALSDGAQRMYLMLISQPDVSHVGILPYTPTRWSRLSPTTTQPAVEGFLNELEAARFVHIDTTTEELLIRSYITYDGAHASPNGKKALRRSFTKIHSRLLATIVIDLLLHHKTDPYEGAIEGASQGALEAPTAPQQPAASSHDPSSSSQPPPDNVVSDPLIFLSDSQREAAAAAFEKHLSVRLKQPDVKMPHRLEATLRRDAPAEWHGAIAAYLTEHQDATADDVLYEVFKINPTTMQRRSA